VIKDSSSREQLAQLNVVIIYSEILPQEPVRNVMLDVNNAQKLVLAMYAL
jgi:hypothetical protein